MQQIKNMHHPEIAIIDPNTLTCLGLQNILQGMIPTAVIRIFHSFGELVDDTPDMYAHYFISAQIYFEHPSFFPASLKQLYWQAGTVSPNWPVYLS